MKPPNVDGLSRPKKRPLACRLGFHRYSTIGSNGWDTLLERCSRCPNYKIVNVILDKELWYGDGLPSWAMKLQLKTWR